MMATLAFSMQLRMDGGQWSTLANNGTRMEHTIGQGRLEQNCFFSFEVGIPHRYSCYDAVNSQQVLEFRSTVSLGQAEH